MKKTKRILAAVLTIVLFASMLSGCGKKELDAAKAVDAYLRAGTKGEFDDYAEMVGEDKEELKKEYDERLDKATAMFDEIKSLGVDLGDDFIGEVKNLLASVKYEVVGAQKEGDGYLVDVDVSPSDAMNLFIKNVLQAAKDANDLDAIGDALVQALRDAIAQQSYGEAKRYQVHLDYNKDEKMYEINESDIADLSADFFDLDVDIEELLSQMYTPSGTVYDNPYLNWTMEDWNAASEDEKTQCCLAMVQEMQGLSDEDMAALDVNDASVQAAIQQIKDGVDLSYKSGMDISIGDYVELAKNQLQ